MTEGPIQPPPINAEKVEVLVNRFADVFRQYCNAEGRTPQSIREALNGMACVAGLAIANAPGDAQENYDYFVFSVRNQIARIIAEKMAAATKQNPPATKG